MKHDPQLARSIPSSARMSFSPGWARPEPSMWPEPKPKFKPAVWRFADAKRALDASHNMVPAEQTERRNLILVNPIEGNTYATTRHLVAAYQCVMAGDMARTHRHSAAALRLVLHGQARHLHGGQRRAHRHGAGRRGADAGVDAGTATSTRATRPATGSTSSTFRSCSSPRRCSSSPIRKAGSSRSPATARRRCGFRPTTALGPGRDAKDGRDRQGRDADDRAASHPPAEGRPCRCRQEHDQRHLRRRRRQGRASRRRRFRRDARPSAT